MYRVFLTFYSDVEEKTARKYVSQSAVKEKLTLPEERQTAAVCNKDALVLESRPPVWQAG